MLYISSWLGGRGEKEGGKEREREGRFHFSGKIESWKYFQNVSELEIYIRNLDIRASNYGGELVYSLIGHDELAASLNAVFHLIWYTLLICKIPTI